MLVCDAIDLCPDALHPAPPTAVLEGVGRPWWWKPNEPALVRMVEAAGFELPATTRAGLHEARGRTPQRPRPAGAALTPSAARSCARWRGDPARGDRRTPLTAGVSRMSPARDQRRDPDARARRERSPRVLDELRAQAGVRRASRSCSPCDVAAAPDPDARGGAAESRPYEAPGRRGGRAGRLGQPQRRRRGGGRRRSCCSPTTTRSRCRSCSPSTSRGTPTHPQPEVGVARARALGAGAAGDHVHALARPRHPVRLPVHHGHRGGLGPLLQRQRLRQARLRAAVGGFDEIELPVRLRGPRLRPAGERARDAAALQPGPWSATTCAR